GRSSLSLPIVFGPGRHPTSGARFLYFQGPDDMVFEYSVGVDEIEDEETHRPRQFGFEPSSLCMWGSKSNRTVRWIDDRPAVRVSRLSGVDLRKLRELKS